MIYYAFLPSRETSPGSTGSAVLEVPQKIAVKLLLHQNIDEICPRNPVAPAHLRKGTKSLPHNFLSKYPFFHKIGLLFVFTHAKTKIPTLPITEWTFEMPYIKIKEIEIWNRATYQRIGETHFIRCGPRNFDEPHGCNKTSFGQNIVESKLFIFTLWYHIS